MKSVFFWLLIRQEGDLNSNRTRFSCLHLIRNNFIFVPIRFQTISQTRGGIEKNEYVQR